MYDESISSQPSARRRPARRVTQNENDDKVEALTLDLAGVSAAYGNTLLFFGYEVEGLMEIVVYPRYRFSSDDRVQGNLGNLRVAVGTPWSLVLPQIDAIFEDAQRYYRRAVSLRSSELRAHGSRYDAAYDSIGGIFRESWHGFSLRLRREGRIDKEGVIFQGEPPDPVLVIYKRQTYTLHVSPTGSIALATGDRRTDLKG